MELPKNILQDTYVRPNIYLCETNKERICKLDPIEFSGVFKFNSYSELNFTIPRNILNSNTGETYVNPYYDKIEGLMNVYVDNFGYFEIQNPKIETDGIKEVKNITAYSLEYVLSQKKLHNLKINTGDPDSIEVMMAPDDFHIEPVTLCNKFNHKLSLLHIILENVFGWSVGHIDNQLAKLSRTFEIDDTTVYDFIINEICKKFNCFIQFDTISNTINIFSDEKFAKFFGDNKTNKFKISPPFDNIGYVSINGYKTTEWNYDSTTGELSLKNVPKLGEIVEVSDSSMQNYQTDVVVSFNNLSKEATIEYDLDDIKTKLNVTYGNNIDIREANLGNPALIDLSYYYTPSWMGESLYNAYGNYIQKTSELSPEYSNNTLIMLQYADKMDFVNFRLSLGYSIAIVNEHTVGTYYIRGGDSPNYYYVQVSLPADYKANTVYYSLKTTNLTEVKANNLYISLKKYYNQDENWEESINKLTDDFKFMEPYTFNNFVQDLKSVFYTENIDLKDQYVIKFLKQMWNEIGYFPLKNIYYETYKRIQTTNASAGWAERNNRNYWNYYPVVIYLLTIDEAMADRKSEINVYQSEYNKYAKRNSEISKSLLLENNFTKEQLNKLNNFIREDTINFDDIIETKNDTISETFRNKEHAIENGKIELEKISQPRLKFSLSMKNIYALPEFEPIINQFQIGNVIRVIIRPDYVKKSRILQVNIDFNDFSNFSCEFGELSNLRTALDIHADLLSQTITAGKSVAENSNKWTQGSDRSNEIDEKINQGLLDAITSIKSIDGTQGVEIDKYGIHLSQIDPITGKKDLKQGWITNNKFLYTDDGFKTTKSVFGEFNYDGNNYYGVISEAVIGGIVIGSKIAGGEIYIGEQNDGTYNFSVNSNGDVVMKSSNIQISGYTTSDDVNNALFDYNKIIVDKISKIQDQIDGQVISYFYPYVPNLNNTPAIDWKTDDEKKAHKNDIFYITGMNPDLNKNNGKIFRWIGPPEATEYQWQEIVDSGLQDALDKASQAQDTADGKKRVFTEQPISPYDVGDLWSTGPQGKLLICKTSNINIGQYDAKDWQDVADYVNSEKAGEIAQNKVDAQTQNDIFNKLTNDGKLKGLYMLDNELYLNATYIKTGELNADLIKTGILDANLIQTGIIQSKDKKTFKLDLVNNTLTANFNSMTITGKTIDQITQDKVDISINAISQEQIFNKLTNNGKLKGLYMQNGELYINASYLKSGFLDASLIKTGKIQSSSGGISINLDDEIINVSNLSGDTILSTGPSGLIVKGKVEADSGFIGNSWHIEPWGIWSGDENGNKTVMQTAQEGKGYWMFAAGGTSLETLQDYKFRVNKDGYTVIEDGILGTDLLGWGIDQDNLHNYDYVGNNVWFYPDRLAANGLTVSWEQLIKSASGTPIPYEILAVATKGTEITCKNGETVLTGTTTGEEWSTFGSTLFTLPNVGVWELSGGGKKSTVPVLEAKRYVVNLGEDVPMPPDPPDPKPPFIDKKTYTIRIYEDDENPTTCCEYADAATGKTPGYDSWKDEPIFKNIKPCILQDWGVTTYLQKSNMSYTEDGQPFKSTSVKDQWFVEVPKIGVKLTRVVSTRTYTEVSLTTEAGKEGFQYYAHSKDAEGDCDKIYIACFLCSRDKNNKIVSVPGQKPLYSFSDILRGGVNDTAAAGKKPELYSFYVHLLVQCLFLLMYKTLNCQSALGKGFIQKEQSSYGNNMITGSTLSKPECFGDPKRNTVHTCFMNIEDPWGGMMYCLDGAFIDKKGILHTTYKGFNENGKGYLFTYNASALGAETSEYITSVVGDNTGGFFPTKLYGSATTHFCDGLWWRKNCEVWAGGWAMNESNQDLLGIFSLVCRDQPHRTTTDITATPTNRTGRVVFKHKEVTA